jgi:NADPH-dependent 2,4-dienoyl-CoA reductase/sulfur reductase-like enzyme/nitrite reductase/ring-hydroxylating ferredoxin subunit
MTKEYTVAHVDDLEDGQMKEVQAGEQAILLVRVEGKYHAYAPTCPHQGAPLAEGVLRGRHLRCPWHQTVFDAATGDLLEPPALDRLHSYDLRVEGQDVIVALPDSAAAAAPAVAGYDPVADGRTFAVVGAGAAGIAAVETLRQEGYRGRLVLISREKALGYDRTELSKRYLRDPAAKRPFIRPDDFRTRLGIEELSGHEVRELNALSRTITFADQSVLRFDKALLATGGEPRRLGVDGEDLPNVFVLRSLADCESIRQLAAGGAKRAVVVGASFLGMEAAASLAHRGLAVTVVAPDTVPFRKVFGEAIGRMYQGVHEAKGTTFRLGSVVQRFEGTGPLHVGLSGEQSLEADLAVVCVGVRPATSYLKGIDLNEDGSVTVDPFLRASKDAFAAGDIARFADWRTGEMIRVEHWRLAMQHGRLAARNMLDRKVQYRGVPFFWTSQHGVVVQYVGCAPTWDEIVFDGEPTHRDFVAYYLRTGHVLAAAGCNQERKMGIIAEVLREEGACPLRHVRAQADKVNHAVAV